MHPRLNELISNAGLRGDVAGTGTNGTTETPSDLTAVIQGAADKIDLLQTVTQSSVNSITANTDAITANSSSGRGTNGSTLLDTIGKSTDGLLTGGGVLSGLFSGGGLIGDAISGLTGLFSGTSSTPNFTQYQAPAARHFELAAGSAGIVDAVSGDAGQPRAAPITEQGLSGIQALNSSGSGGSETGSRANAANQQVTVNIQAMDSQSFMDRSSDIAQAVRRAMLNMSSLNDVISDL